MTAVTTVPLGDVATVERSSVQPDDIRPGTVYVGLEDIESGGRILGARQVDPGDLASTKFSFTESHVLYGKLRPYLAKIAAPDFAGICSTDIVPVLPGPHLDRRYLLHFLRQPTMVAFASARSVGINLPRLSPSVLETFPVPLPPLPEQRRIAAILDQADALRAKRRNGLAKLESLTHSIFVDMFGDPATNPKRLPVEAFGANVRSIRYGTGSPPPYVADGVPFIRATNVKAGTVASKDLKFISPLDAQRISKCRLSSGNLIVVRSGVNTGDCAIIPKEYDGACAAFDLIVELAHEDAVYYNFLINSPFGKAQIARLSRRAAQPHLNAEQLKSLEYIAPPPDYKAEFCRRISGIERLESSLASSLSTLDQFFGSLQHRAFRGEL